MRCNFGFERWRRRGGCCLCALVWTECEVNRSAVKADLKGDGHCELELCEVVVREGKRRKRRGRSWMTPNLLSLIRGRNTRVRVTRTGEGGCNRVS